MATATGQIGVGIVGIGFRRAVHLPALRLDPRFNVQAICASTLPRARRIADECGIPQAYGDWRELLAAPGIEAVTVAVPPPLQPAIAIAALEQGKHVFCEKPLADTAVAARQMAAAATAGRLANMVDFEFTTSPAWATVKEALDARQRGPVAADPCPLARRDLRHAAPPALVEDRRLREAAPCFPSPRTVFITWNGWPGRSAA